MLAISQSDMQSADSTHAFGKWAGLITFFAGTVLLVAVFAMSLAMLSHPVPGLAQSLDASKGSQADLPGAGKAITTFLLKLAALFVMTIAASLIASKGIQLYLVSAHRTAHTDESNGPP